uniref:glutaredoxin-dependent peroxiredoxin n=1 Tax=Polytomella parva TaxID=51329 RepID=A0A7S0UQP9_9CHLO|mmetsp:Transcript_12997/g.23115  ORF Transcript_12997/g.23115 Transcript_12997/m.23115 type:complete len:213 (+) Transcript_12997:83-721(+)
MVLIGKSIPEITGLTFLKGSPVPIGVSSQDKSTVTVIEFWATWCPPCRDTIPHLTSLQKKYKDKCVNIVGISIEQDLNKVKQFVDGQGSRMDYTVAIDTSQNAQRKILEEAGRSGIPYALVVDISNKVTYAGHPMDPAFSSALDKAANSASDRRTKCELPLITQSREELMAMPAKELKKILTDRNLSYEGLFEKELLVEKIIEFCSKVKYSV